MVRKKKIEINGKSFVYALINDLMFINVLFNLY